MRSAAARRDGDDVGRRQSSFASAGKRARYELSTEKNESLFSALLLHNKADAQLLAWLFECHRVLRAATSPISVGADFLKELLGPRYLKSSLNGVQQMTGCLLADLVRLNNGRASGEKTATLPFDTRHADDVLTCLTAPFEQVFSGKAPLKTCEHIIERASASHIFLHLIPHCRQSVQERLTCLFGSIQHASGTSSTVGTAANGDNAITAITAAEMGSVLVDVLNATKSIVSEQLAPLLREVTAASSTLVRHTEANRGSAAIGRGATAAGTTRRKSRTPGAIIAAHVFLEQMDVIQAAIASHTAEMVEHGAGEVSAAEVSGDNVEARRRGLRSIGQAMESLVALMELHVDLVAQLVPALLPYLQHDHADIRLLLLRGFFMAFDAHETAAATYRSAFNALLTRFNDPKHVLRIEMVQLAGAALNTAAKMSSSVAEQRAHDLLPHLELRLIDPHALVRRAAVVAYSDIAINSSSLVTSERMEKTLGLRVADKNYKVRQIAVEQLSNIYRILQYPWIPNVVMRCPNAEGGVALLESVFELMLPPPSKVTATEVSLNSSHQSALSGRRSAQANMALFDFEKANATRERTYVEGFAALCSHLSPWAFKRLIALAEKKAQLRRAIFRLFHLRAEVRTKDLKSSEGQEMIDNIHRLLSFLQNMTHAEKGEWDTLFRAKDDKVSRAFLTCCANGHLRYATEREQLIKTLKGRVEGPVLKFVQDTLSRQMMLPLEVEHLDELLARLRGALRGVCRDGYAKVDTETRCEVEGMLRALVVFGRAAPSFLPRCAVSVVEFVDLLCQGSHTNLSTSWMILLLNCVADWAGDASKSRPDEKGNEKNTATSAIASRQDGLLTTLARLCTCDYESFFSDAAVKEVGEVCKHAARCFMALLGVHGVQESKALSQLVDSIRDRICGTTTPLSRSLFGWLKALTAFAKDPVAAPLVQDESLVRTITRLLQDAVRDNTETSDSVKVKTRGAETLFMSLAGEIVDAAGKCLTAVAMSYSSDRVGVAVTLALNSLLGAYKATSERDTHSVGACRRRLSINQQLAKLVIRPSPEIGKELAVAVILSAEDEALVRHPVQKKITLHLMRNCCDMRYAALLLLTAISEETKGGYQHLRSLLQQVGDHLRSKQRTSGATLSSPEALTCFLEYAIPFLVLLMAHHTFYTSEQENHFVAYQRVWHLLFDELFRHGTQCASFVVELFSRIKQTDDVLDRESHTTRLLCDLGSRVMQECLGQRQISAEALKRYPGRVLLPTFFVLSTSATDALNTVYLDTKVHVFSHVPFRAPAAPAAVVAAAAGGEAVVLGDKSSFVARGTTADGADDDDDDDGASDGDVGILLPTSLQRRVDGVLDALVGRMTKEEMVRLRWADVRRRLREVLAAAGGDAGDVAEADVVAYAKQQLRVLYAGAPPQ